MTSFLRELHQAARGLCRRPVILIAAVVSMGLGVGGTSALLGVLDALLLRPPGQVRDPDQIVRLNLSQDTAAIQSIWASYPMYEVLRDQAPGLAGLAAYASKSLVIGTGSHARTVAAEFVTPSYFSVLGTEPAMGRFFGAEDESTISESPLVISYGLWQTAFGGLADALGESMYIGDRLFTVVGIAPSGFTGIDKMRIDVWLPMDAARQLLDSEALDSPTMFWLGLFGRLANTARDWVGNEATTILRSSSGQYDLPGNWRVVPGSVIDNRGRDRSSDVRLSISLAVSSVLLLLLASANIANLLLLRFLSRTQELATRAALGASSGQLVRLAAFDSGIVAVMGGLVAMAIVHWTGAGARALLLPGLDLPGSSIDVRMACQIGLLTLTAAVSCGAPSIVFVATRRRWMGSRARTGRGTAYHRMTAGTLVVIQCGISVVLLVSTGLLSRSLHNVTSLELGLDTEQVLYASADLRTNVSRASELALYETLSKRIRAIPGVDGVTLAMGLPLRNVWAVATTLPAEVWTGPNPVVLGHAVGPSYFTISGLRITRGRAFESADHAPPARVAVINETFARTYWPNKDPLGACLLLGSDELCTTVIGVAVDSPRWSITADRECDVYIPISHLGEFGTGRTLALVIRTNGNPRDLILPIRMAIQATSSWITYVAISPVKDIVAPQVRPWRVGTTLFSSFAIIAIILSCVGLYGLLAFLVASQKHSIGVRMALGASPSVVRRRVVVSGIGLCTLGAAGGMFVAVILAPVAESFVFGVAVRDFVVYAGSAVVVLVTAVAASWLPGRRAAGLDPAALLRSD